MKKKTLKRSTFKKLNEFYIKDVFYDIFAETASNHLCLLLTITLEDELLMRKDDYFDFLSN
jgi:hypothetical protein